MWVGEDLEVIEEVGSDLGLVGQDVVARRRGFVAAEERFPGRVVVATALAAHAQVHPEPGPQALVAIWSVETARGL